MNMGPGLLWRLSACGELWCHSSTIVKLLAMSESPAFVNADIITRSVLLGCQGFVGRDGLVVPLNSVVDLRDIEAISPTQVRHQWKVTLSSGEASRMLVAKGIVPISDNKGELRVY